MKWLKGPIAVAMALVISTGLAVVSTPAAFAGASAKSSVGSRLAGSEPKAVENCGSVTCTTYSNRQRTRVLANDLPPLMKSLNVVTAVQCSTVFTLAAKGAARAAGKIWSKAVEGGAGAVGAALDAWWEVCKSDQHKSLEEIGHQAELAKAAKGCLEVEKYQGKIIRIGYNTNPDWCGGS